MYKRDIITRNDIEVVERGGGFGNRNVEGWWNKRNNDNKNRLMAEEILFVSFFGSNGIRYVCM